MWGPEYWLQDDFSELSADAEKQLVILSQRFLNAAMDRDKARSLSSHIAHVQQRVKDVHRILKRLMHERRALLSLDMEIRKQTPKDLRAGVAYPDTVQQLYKEMHELTGYLELDIETLYQFGAVLLDQWAHMVTYLGAWNEPEDHDFANLVQCLENPNNRAYSADIAAVIYQPNVELVHRLFMQFRTYRNKFIVHRKKPWQRSSKRDFIRGEYVLWSPILPGSHTDERENELIQMVLDVASRGPEWFQPLLKQTNYQGMLQLMLRHSHEWSLADRNRLIEAASSLGFEAETFQELGKCLLEFIRDTIPQAIRLGEDMGTLPTAVSP